VTAYGFRAADRAQTVFYFIKDNERMRMATVVDDSLVSYNKQRRFDDFIATLRLQIPIAVQEVSVLCGLRIIRDMDGGYLTVDQEQYIDGWADGDEAGQSAIGVTGSHRCNSTMPCGHEVHVYVPSTAGRDEFASSRP
jgi:hypothetical protein